MHKIAYPIRFAPIYMERIWGGRTLETKFYRQLPPGKTIGESWEISDCGHHSSTIAKGPLRGMRLSELMTRSAEAVVGSAASCLQSGQAGPPRFPLLVKWIDARERLSVQVHPPDGHPRVPPGERGKSECWFVVDAEPGAEIFVGLKRGIDRRALEHELARGTADRCMNALPARPGDFYYVPAGTIHAIGGGVLIAEVQQSSDVTFRLFDWNRLDAATGRPRDLHIAAALDVIDFNQPPPQPEHVESSPDVGAIDVELTPEQCPHFAVTWRCLTADCAIGSAERAHILICVRGDALVAGRDDAVPIGDGDCVLLPGGGEFQCRPGDTLELLDVQLP